MKTTRMLLRLGVCILWLIILPVLYGILFQIFHLCVMPFCFILGVLINILITLIFTGFVLLVMTFWKMITYRNTNINNNNDEYIINSYNLL